MNHCAYTSFSEEKMPLKSRSVGSLISMVFLGYMGTVISGGCFGMALAGATRMGFFGLGTIIAGAAGFFPFLALAVISGFCRSIPALIACSLTDAATGFVSITWLAPEAPVPDVALALAFGFGGGLLGALLGSFVSDA